MIKWVYKVKLARLILFEKGGVRILHKAYFDASVEWNKKKATIAYIIYSEDGNVVTEVIKNISFYDNNYAEWLALNSLLKTLRKLKIDEVEIYGDNLNVINIANGQASNKKNRELHRIIWKYGSKFKQITFNWIRRNKNKKADKLSRSQKNVVNAGNAVNSRNRKSKIKNKNNTYIIHPNEFDFNFRYRETKRKIIAR
jgi:ribonuclease HI